MPQETYLEKQEENISIHIFSVSAGMVGVCLTVIGIINMITTFKRSETWADEITALDAMIFLGSCVISYIAIKTPDRKRRLVLEKISDLVFLGGLAIMAVICVFIVVKLA